MMKIRLANPYFEAPLVWGQPLFVDGSGRPVYLGRGADGADDDGEGEPDSGGDGDADGDGDGEGGDKDEKGKPSPADEAALKNKIKLADKRAAEAERRLRELEDKDKGALEVAERKLAEATETNAKLAAQVKAQALENAFLKVNDITWHDPDDALTAATRQKLLEGVQDEDGEVDMAKLKTALAKLAKAKPHYVKSKADEEEEQPKGGSGPTGTPTGSGRKKGNPSGPSEAELRARYGAIRR
jgi:hypothetical protein